ncbi:MAG: tRNA (adenosine(37)-N6)-threonylcarbamoyltransferase complex ATPase subunit type 1 TsaE [Bacteroidales bacterium]|nr:tRNA (adenosine(37)-N6)-threonylcarbamoyltransferase complex ATPase subunit type 1 TsaE [Bacteroidales bacterium]
MADLPEIARKLLAAYPGKRIFAFYGGLGAGKTTFIKAVCSELGATEDALSPTFALINEYRTTGGESLYHFDFFRISKLEEVYDIGYEEYFFGGNYCLIEWPELIETLLPEESVKVTITGTAARTIQF